MKSFLLFVVVSSIVYTAIGQDEIAYAPIPIDRSKLLDLYTNNTMDINIVKNLIYIFK